ncbi:MAG: beta-N-acetylhexosaminidase [Novosphingobium sp.]|nr:beta-N-acetylhexosaminidase [Novosphingobium sp.]
MTISARTRRTRGLLAMAIFGALACATAVAAEPPLAALMPMPVSIERSEGALRLDGPIAPRVEGCAHAMVPDGVARFSRDLVLLAGEPKTASPLPLAIRCLVSDRKLLSLEAREGYRLLVDPSGLSIEADGETGVLRALATLRQLVGRDGQGAVIPAVRIADSPRFAWRGLMLDPARHFISVETIKRQIDAMELAKLNVLHLHLSDNEGFRVESRRFPRLTTVASHGRYYTQEEIRDLVRYAGLRGVRIVPEFDIPGHSMALLTAYPELAVAPIDPKDPLAKQKSALNPASEKTYRFLEKLLGEMAALFPDKAFHIGGDEVSDVAWHDSAEVEAFKTKHGLKSKIEIEARFHERVRAILARHGKITIGWDEIAESPLPDDVIVQVWRSSNPVFTATAQGNRVIVSAGFYLNNLQTAEFHYGIDLLDPMAYSTMSEQVLAALRRNPVTAAQVSDGLVARPMPPLTERQKALVIGGEAPLWGEMVNDELVDGRLWPRALALAERFWSPDREDTARTMADRLHPATERLRSLGLRDEAIRRRMIARLAPDDPEPVARLIGLVGPIRHGANHPEALMGGKPDLVGLSDIASTDPAPAQRFCSAVRAYLAGDRTQAAWLRSEMEIWVANLGAFEQVARGRPLLEKAIPTARDIAALGRLGLRALAAIELGRPLDPALRPEERELIERMAAFEAASTDFGTIATMKHPESALLVLVWPEVRALAEAATAPAGPGE